MQQLPRVWAFIFTEEELVKNGCPCMLLINIPALVLAANGLSAQQAQY